MPPADLPAFSLEGLSPSELEQRRRAIVSKYLGGDSNSAASLDEMSIEDLRELSAITSALRRRTAGPPKAKAKSGKPTKAKPTITDVLDLL